MAKKNFKSIFSSKHELEVWIKATPIKWAPTIQILGADNPITSDNYNIFLFSSMSIIEMCQWFSL